MLYEILVQLDEHILCFSLLALGDGVEVHVLKQKIAQLIGRGFDLRGHTDMILISGRADDRGYHGVDTLGVLLTKALTQMRGNIVNGKYTCAAGVIDIVIDIGDLIGIFDQHALKGTRTAVVDRAGVVGNTVSDLPRQIQTKSAIFQLFHHAHALHIV